MGSASSKPARKLASSIEKDAASAVLASRKGNVNTLPSQSLKEKYAQHMQMPEHETHLPLRGESFRGNTTLDVSKLNKKLQKKKDTQNVPEGKDGFDPQVEPSYKDSAFANSVMRLGAQIHSHSVSSFDIKSSSALKLIHNREALYKQGEKELEDERNGELLKRSVIHPRALGGLLNDLNDPRIATSRVLKDALLDESFIGEWCERFKPATQVLVVKEEAKEGEILVQNTAPSTTEIDIELSNAMAPEFDESGSLKEGDPHRLKVLKNRLGIDE